VFNRAAAKSDSKRNNHAYKTNDNIIRVPGGCPAIISKSLFEKVQRIKAANRRNTGRYHSKEFYLLTGKVFCGVCGKRIQGNLRFSGERKNRHCTYRCDEPKQLCKNKENNKDYLDAYVADLLRQKIFNKAALRRRINAVNKYIGTYNAEFDEHYESIKTELEEVTIALANITAAVEKGVLTDAIIERSEALEQRKSEIQAQLAELRRFEPLRLEDYLHLIDDYKNMKRNTAEFRTFVQTYIDKVVTYPYHIEIVLDVGFGITDELKETITIRRGDLYALFESRTED
jgi:site-specific DNA recombinase